VPGNSYEEMFKFFEKKNAAGEEWAKFHHELPDLSFKPAKGEPITEVTLNVGYVITMPSWAKASSEDSRFKRHFRAREASHTLHSAHCLWPLGSMGDGGPLTAGEPGHARSIDGSSIGLPRRCGRFASVLKLPGAPRAGTRGGARACRPKCVRIFSITGCSRMAAMIFSSPPQFGQCSRSSSNTRLSSRAPDELRQVDAGGIFGLVAFAVNRGAIGRPAGLLHRGLHALLMSRLWFTVSKPSGAPLPSVAPSCCCPPQGVNELSGVPRSDRKLQIRAPEPDGQEHPQMAATRRRLVAAGGQLSAPSLTFARTWSATARRACSHPRDLGVRGMRLMTNNQRKLDGIADFGLHIVERVPLVSPPQDENAAYLMAKQVIMGHMLGMSP
jgi:hypothetical protein